MKRWWPALLILFTCVPCVGLGWLSSSRMNAENRIRERRGEAALAAVEAFKADAGAWPERLELALPGEDQRQSLIYEVCPKSSRFQLSYVEAGPGFLPSDFARTWEPQLRRWKSHEMGLLPPCE